MPAPDRKHEIGYVSQFLKKAYYVVIHALYLFHKQCHHIFNNKSRQATHRTINSLHIYAAPN
jgi:hypothetical protein